MNHAIALDRDATRRLEILIELQELSGYGRHEEGVYASAEASRQRAADTRERRKHDPATRAHHQHQERKRRIRLTHELYERVRCRGCGQHFTRTAWQNQRTRKADSRACSPRCRGRRGERLYALGRDQTVAAWEAETGLKQGTIYSRLARGWPPDLAVSKPATDPRDRSRGWWAQRVYA
jgi:hypothetical protein